MATVNHTILSETRQQRVLKLAAMNHNDVSDALSGVGWDHAWFFAEGGSSAATSESAAVLEVRAAIPGPGSVNIIAEDAQKNTHLRMAISSTEVVTAGRLRGPIPPGFTVKLVGVTNINWNVYVVLQKTPTHDRGKG